MERCSVVIPILGEPGICGKFPKYCVVMNNDNIGEGNLEHLSESLKKVNPKLLNIVKRAYVSEGQFGQICGAHDIIFAAVVFEMNRRNQT